MTSAANSATQSLNFIPQWLRSSSNSDSTTSSTNNSKISTSRLRYSKEEILGVRTKLSASLLKSIRQEIVKNLKEVESVCQPQILSPSTLNGLTEEENAEIPFLTNFICGRTSTGANRTATNNNNNNSNIGQNPTEIRKHRETGSFPNRNRVQDDRDHQAAGNRRAHGNIRNSSDDWRRHKTDDDEHKDAKDENATSKSSRNGPNKRPERSMEQRTKSDEKWSSNDHRSNSTNQFENNTNRAGSGWRKLGPVPDRNVQSRRPPSVHKEEMPEWMDETLDGDGQAGMATFEQDGTYIRASNFQSASEEKPTPKSSQSTLEEVSPKKNTVSSKAKEQIESDKSTSPPADTPVVTIPNAPKQTIPQTSPPVQKAEPAWEEDFDHHDVATTVVESTLAEDYEESALSAVPVKSLSIKSKPSPPAAINIPPKPVNPDDKIWFYKDPQNTVQGPFTSSDMERWYAAGYFTLNLPVKRIGEKDFSTIQQLSEQLGRLPFRADTVSGLHARQSQQQQQQQQNAINAVLQKKSAPSHMNPTSTSSNAFMNHYLAQQQQQQSARQHVQNSLPFNNRPTSMSLSANDLKRTSSQSQMHIHSPQSASSLVNANPLNDPAIIYSQQRSLPSGNQSMPNTNSYEDSSRTFRQLSSQPNTSNNVSFFLPNGPNSQQNNESILARLNQAAQIHTKHQQDKMDEHRRRDFQQTNELDLQRLRIYPQLEADRFKRQENDFRFKQEQQNSRSMMPDSIKKPSNMSMENYLYMQSQMHPQNDQSQIDAIKAENVRRYQQHYQEHSQNHNLFQTSEGSHWSRHSSFPNDQSQYNDTQDSEQERRLREAASALLAHQNPKNRSTGNLQTNSWNPANPSYQDVHRQQTMQNEGRSQMMSMWDDHSQRASQQSTNSNFWDQQYSSSSSNKQGPSNSNNSSYVPILR